jgi:threonine dehydrogenase-like Zn-dependent dehydrogenase
MPQATAPSRPTGLKGAKRTMKAAVFAGPGRIELVEKPVPRVGPTDALMRVTTTTICGTDVHILKGEYSVKPGLTLGHEPVGVIEELGDHTVVTTLCPGGKERMRRLMGVVATGRADLTPLVTHRFCLEQIAEAYELFGNQRDGVLKVAITP